MKYLAPFLTNGGLMFFASLC